MKKLLATILIAAMAMPFATQAFAAGRDEIQSRMIARKGQIDSIKDKGIIGENNKGYLAVVTGSLEGGDKRAVDAENADRATVYTTIAEKEGTTADHVGRRRAKQLAAQAKSGHYIMDDAGNWKKK